VKATQIIEELERLVTEFGDLEGQIPDPVENWWYPVDRIARAPESEAFRFVSDH
jgi:hypothetical protein